MKPLGRVIFKIQTNICLNYLCHYDKHKKLYSRSFFYILIENVLKPFRKGLEPRDLNPSVEGMSAENPFLKVRIPSKYLQRSYRVYIEFRQSFAKETFSYDEYLKS